MRADRVAVGACRNRADHRPALAGVRGTPAQGETDGRSRSWMGGGGGYGKALVSTPPLERAAEPILQLGSVEGRRFVMPLRRFEFEHDSGRLRPAKCGGEIRLQILDGFEPMHVRDARRTRYRG